MVNWAKIDLWIICFLIGISIFIVWVKLSYDSANWWTGFFPLGLLPVAITDYLKDRKKQFNSQHTNNKI